jgi:ATP-dependent DNA helicase RecQ
VCVSHREQFDATVIAQKILSAVIRTGQRFGAGYIAHVLTGDKDERIKRFGHHALSVFGIVKDFKKSELISIIRQLAAFGLLAQTQGEYPVIKLTHDGSAFLKQRQTLYLPQIIRREKLKSWRQDESAADYDEELFQQLRALRKTLANRRGMPPYVIFGDATLKEMAAYFPQSTESLREISGVGAQKLEQFGEVFLAIIRNYAKSRGLVDVPRQTYSEPKEIVFGSTYDKTISLLQQKLQPEEIARQRGLSLNTIIDHIEKLAAQNEAPSIDHLRPRKDRLQTISASFKKSGGFALSPVREDLGESYSYTELKLARIFIRRDER